ncbi:MAG: OadG family protein [Deltaproteobacteria bacterium]|nr:OadG family protein [Deltaproteobacteria bacterium]
MSETVFSLWFAVMGMTAVFTVITILTLAMVLTGAIFAGRGRKPAAAPKPRKLEEEGSVQEKHVAVIAAALAIYRAELEADVILLAGHGEPRWTGDGRRRVPPGDVPALRRTR